MLTILYIMLKLLLTLLLFHSHAGVDGILDNDFYLMVFSDWFPLVEYNTIDALHP